MTDPIESTELSSTLSALQAKMSSAEPLEPHIVEFLDAVRDAAAGYSANQGQSEAIFALQEAFAKAVKERLEASGVSKAAREFVRGLVDSYAPSRVEIDHPPDNNGAAASYYEVDFALGSKEFSFFVHCDDHEEPSDSGLYLDGDPEDLLVDTNDEVDASKLEATRQSLGAPDESELTSDLLVWLLWSAADPRPAGAYYHLEWTLAGSD